MCMDRLCRQFKCFQICILGASTHAKAAAGLDQDDQKNETLVHLPSTLPWKGKWHFTLQAAAEGRGSFQL